MRTPLERLAPAAVLFDMDGTLVQSREAVWRLFDPINRRFELGIDSAEDFYEIFTQNLHDGMRRRCGDPDTATRVVEEFFEQLRHQYRPQFVPGMVEVIRSLAATTTLAVVTTNVMDVVRQTLVDHGVATCFAHVFSGDVEPSKARVIRHLRTNAAYTLSRHCTPHYDENDEAPPSSDGELVMVTDTVGDVRAAISEGIRAIGVSWGMHTEERLMEAGADGVALWPQELLTLLGDNAQLTAQSEACTTACHLRDVAAVHAGGDDQAASVRSAGADPASLLDRVRAGHERRRTRWPVPAAPSSEGAAERVDVGDVAAPPSRQPDARLAAAVRRIVPRSRR